MGQLLKIKQVANIAIEEKRSSKKLDQVLEADIKLSVNKKQFELLNNLDLENILSHLKRKILSEKEE